jgi:uncharacterized protein involved in response to NO
MLDRTPSLLTIGFRPFFLLAALFAVAWMPLWLLIHGGEVVLASHLGPFGWHGHEMVFGFTLAVVAGFLLTAVRNWTGQPTPRGAALATLALVWVAARAGMLLIGSVPVDLVMAVDAAFPALVGVSIAVPILKAKNRRNAAFPVLLLLLAAANVLHHLRFGGVAPLGVAFDPMRAALDILILIIAVVGGRIVPAFTRNAVRPHPVRPNNRLDQLGLASLVALCLLNLVPGAGQVAAVAALVAGALNAARMVGWGTRFTLRSPLLWILHVSWLWLCVALVLQGVAGLSDGLSPNVALHALTVGAIGNFTLGMMARVSLGHSGRKLEAHPVMVVAFVLMNAAALLRVLGPVLMASPAALALRVSGGLLGGAFLLYLVIYAPMLLGPRADGKAD